MSRILVVEDNRDNMTLIVDVLVSLGHTVMQAMDGEEGVRITRAENPDLVLMDLSLPRLDGWSATSQIKSDPKLKSIPVIALTAHAMIGDRERALEAGCDDYLTKPINLGELIDKINEYLEG